ncbi:MAG: hypothetical protein PHW64_00355 [Sulfuricurvum sp.]|nr:hypothetical protein [Sulfuricurvum sp.]
MFLDELEKVFIAENSHLRYDQDFGLYSQNIHTDSSVLHVFIAGIGMNAKTFAMPFNYIVKNHSRHLLAITLIGFGENDQQTDYSEVEQIKDASLRILRFASTKKNISKINLFGFSYGADLLCGIAEQLKEDIERQHRKIAILRMVISEININTDTAFITGRICQIGKQHDEADEADKKAEFMRELLLNKRSPKEVLDNLEYLRASYRVSWLQMERSAGDAYNHANNRISDLISFCAKNKYTWVILYSRKSLDINIRLVNLTIKEPLASHFDGISLSLIKDADSFMSTGKQKK